MSQVVVEVWRRVWTQVRQDDGQGLVEYALIIAFIALAIVGSAAAFGTQLAVYYSNISAAVLAAGS